MNKQLIAERFSKAIHTYSQEACVQRQIADKMTRLLTEHLIAPCPKVIEFGCGTGVYSRLLLKALQPDELLLNDLCPEMEQCCSDLLKEKQISFLPGDAETVSFPGQRSLITSCSALQWFESPRRFFERCHSLLQQQGYFAFSTFGEENMKEIRQLTGSGLSYPSREELLSALSAHFQVLYSEEEHIPLSFDTPLQVLYHLKQTGVTGVTSSACRPLRTRRDLQCFCERYAREFSQGSSVSLTYHPIYMVAQKKKQAVA